MFPLANYQYELPELPSPGAFGAVRKYDVHTGVDLYCEDGDDVRIIEDGVITAIIPFTGANAESPWWEETFAVLIYNAENDRTILYGEIIPAYVAVPEMDVYDGWYIGSVKRVLKKDKGVVASTSMLHMEVYQGRVDDCVWWRHNEAQPEKLLDVTPILRKELP